MAGAHLALLAAKATLILLLALLVVAVLRRQSAALRALAAQAAVLALLALPALWLVAPAIEVDAPLPLAATLDDALRLPAPAGAGAPADAGASAAPDLPWKRAIVPAYLAGLVFCLLGPLAGLVHLRRLARLARPIDDRRWHAALVEARRRLGIGREVELLLSDRIDAPLGWGLLRPVVLIDAATAARAAPEAVLLHELAHVARFDWPALIAARLASAVYWFHPLAWILVARMEQDIECAADDRVLACGSRASDYAQLLLAISRNAGRAPAPAANAIAASGSALARRIGALLDATRTRTPLRRWQGLAGLAAAFACATPLAALEPVGERLGAYLPLAASAAERPGDAAARALDTLGNPNFSALANAIRAESHALRHARQPASFRQRAAIAPLLLALEDRRPVVRRLALWGLSEMRFIDTAPAVAAMLDDADGTVRAEAARALGDMDDTASTLRIAAMLGDAQPSVRRQAAHALGDLADARALPALRAARDDPDQALAATVRWALAQIE